MLSHETRIAGIKYDLVELLNAARMGDLDDWATGELGLIAELANEAWRTAVARMVQRMIERN